MTEIDSETDLDGKPEGGGANGDKARSETRYPYFGLSQGINVIKAVQRAGGVEAASADVLREMGLTKVTDRLWAYGIPAAVQFGLVERLGRGDGGRIKLTDLGHRLALPGTDDEERAAKKAAFKTPELYTKLLERFAGSPVTKDGLKNLLQREYKIVESMAPQAAEAFLDSLKVAELLSPSNTVVSEGTPRSLEESPKPPVPIISSAQQPVGTKAVYVPENFVIYKCKITGGQVIDIPLPPKFAQSDVKRLYAFLQTQVDEDVEGGGGQSA